MVCVTVIYQINKCPLSHKSLRINQVNRTLAHEMKQFLLTLYATCLFSVWTLLHSLLKYLEYFFIRVRNKCEKCSTFSLFIYSDLLLVNLWRTYLNKNINAKKRQVFQSAEVHHKDGMNMYYTEPKLCLIVFT